MAVEIEISGSAVLGFAIGVLDADEGDRLLIERIDNTGYYTPVRVRGADFVVPTADTMVFHDYEAPFDSDITYRVSSFALSDLENPINSDEIFNLDTQVPRGFAMMSQVFDPSQCVTGSVTKDGLQSWKVNSRIISESNILNRRNPVIISDVQSGREGSIKVANLITHDIDFDGNGARVPGHTELGPWRTIFENGSTMLFRSVVEHTGFDDMFFKCMGVEISREEGGVSGFYDTDWPLLIHTVDYKEVDRPMSTLEALGFATWQTVFDNNSSWGEVNSDHTDWLDVLLNPEV